MSAAKFRAMYGWELRRNARSTLVWSVLLILCASFVFGALSSSRLHAEREQAQQRAWAEQQDWYADLQRRAREYSQPGPQVPYWQDPTNVAGFSRYFLFAQAFKPVQPAAPLAVGVADLAPDRLRVRLETPFAVTPTYDFEHPRLLAVGQFDLAFAVAYLLPVGLILILGLAGTAERDNGVLRLIASQPVSPVRWLGAKVAALATLSVPGVLLGLLLALGLAGVPFDAAAPQIGAALLLVTAYALLWLALGFVVLSYWSGAAGAMGALAAIWGMWCVGLPMLADSVTALRAAPQSVMQIDALRAATDEVDGNTRAVIETAFKQRDDLRGHEEKIAGLDYSTRWTFLAPALEQQLESTHHQHQQTREAGARWSANMTWLVPALAVLSDMAVLAGTDIERHLRYERQVRDYQLQLRDAIYPRVQQEIVSPTPQPAGVQGRMNLLDYDFIPTFQMQESASPALAVVARSAGLHLGLALVLMGWACARLRWPQQL